MAINKAIIDPPKSHGGLRNCIEYVLRFGKVKDELYTIIGPYEYDQINYDLVYQSFLHEKQLWNKDHGRMCIHNVISWHKDEDITPQEAFAFGLEFAEKWFSGFQTVVAVHQDKEHIHCHFVTNSVSYENGKKYHSSKKDLETMKQMTNQMCKEKGFSVAQKGKHFDGTDIEAGEVITWNKNKYNIFKNNVKQSYVWDCAKAFISAVKDCFSRELFCNRMQASGWTVHWSEQRKHITFENKEGKKVRDSNLSKTFHLSIGKEELEHEFIRQRTDAENVQRELAGYYRELEELGAGSVSDDTATDIGIGSSEELRETAGQRSDRKSDEAYRRTEAVSPDRDVSEQDASGRKSEIRKKNRRRSGPEL
ncbi:MAG: relaxase/mobilization nuclease domain-containing protein [Anaerobutyricum hallii]|uniref:relaxase/mobilization nuclease domain-containing protein n=1 Tax=Anaerobutyricum hallii TaxID=39488 RepID=UPI00242EC6D2|nr:relaxase/mobilization nuclease domain-containing protein [Anaerobutyricum hallii]MDD6587990.1 relaxase/mobilization nuclease domain-containing protein [Anaerobutyricum hallii]